MKNTLEIINDKINRPNLSANTIKWVGIFATCTSILLNSQQALGESLDISNNKKQEDQTDVFYETLRNEMSFSIKGFTETIKEQNPELIVNDKKIVRAERNIISASKINIKNNNLYNPYKLTEENINSIRGIKKSLIFLLDSMYGEGYSHILSDGKDHSNKELVIDIIEIDGKYKLRQISIKDIPNEEQINNEGSLINNNEIIKV